MYIGPKDMANILNIKPVTVRKYSEILERAGYVITRSESGRRQYTQKDATVFVQMKELCERSGMTIEAAANYVVAHDMKENGTIATLEISPPEQSVIQYEERYNEIKQFMMSLEEQNRNQEHELDRLHQRMDEQNSNLTVLLREVLETRRMLASAEEERRNAWKFWRRKK